MAAPLPHSTSNSEKPHLDELTRRLDVLEDVMRQLAERTGHATPLVRPLAENHR